MSIDNLRVFVEIILFIVLFYTMYRLRVVRKKAEEKAQKQINVNNKRVADQINRRIKDLKIEISRLDNIAGIQELSESILTMKKDEYFDLDQYDEIVQRYEKIKSLRSISDSSQFKLVTHQFELLNILKSISKCDHSRPKPTTLSELENERMLQDAQTDWSGHYNRSYKYRRKGRVSRNPIILILDFLCQRENRYEPHTYFLYFSSFTFSIVFFFNGFFEEWWGHNFLWLLWAPVGNLFFLDNLYRYLRNKYLKKHNLPGPYGWGTIDDFQNLYAD